MDLEVTYPRVNGKTIGNFRGQGVLLVGEIVGEATTGQAMIRCTDGTDATVILQAGDQLESKYVQIMGTARDGNVIEAQRIQCFAGNFDMGMYNKALELADGKYAHLFK